MIRVTSSADILSNCLRRVELPGLKVGVGLEWVHDRLSQTNIKDWVHDRLSHTNLKDWFCDRLSHISIKAWVHDRLFHISIKE